MFKQCICTQCGIAFQGGSTAIFCPTCRIERTRQHDRERYQRKQAGQIRNIGSTDLCVICKQPYTVNAGQQKYCPPCQTKEAARRRKESFNRNYADPVKRAKSLARSRRWAIDNKERAAEILRNCYERRRETKKESRRKRCGLKLRPLGREENCLKCGLSFIVKERNQRYCENCKTRR